MVFLEYVHADTKRIRKFPLLRIMLNTRSYVGLVPKPILAATVSVVIRGPSDLTGRALATDEHRNSVFYSYYRLYCLNPDRLSGRTSFTLQ